MKKDIPAKAAQEFLDSFEQRMHLEQNRLVRHEKIIAEKSQALIPFRMLLKKLVDAGAYVNHHGLHDPGSMVRSHAPQLLQVWEDQSSPKWQPGVSLFLDHPAKIEIAIPNPNQQTDHGVVVVMCSTDHPHSYLLKGPFVTIDEACVALAKFLSLSTQRIERPNMIRDAG